MDCFDAGIRSIDPVLYKTPDMYDLEEFNRVIECVGPCSACGRGFSLLLWEQPGGPASGLEVLKKKKKKKK